MRSVILCEGFDDVVFIGYLLHKYSISEPKWNYVRWEKSEYVTRHFKLLIETFG